MRQLVDRPLCTVVVIRLHTEMLEAAALACCPEASPLCASCLFCQGIMLNVLARLNDLSSPNLNLHQLLEHIVATDLALAQLCATALAVTQRSHWRKRTSVKV
eukprot:TRINITY_DN26392_c0_g1_i1.p1 TRINITY_DN26392_c0_g1~~TRINITY_DN26392_c0_g1_i1.p1  ORF type:complete len:103 (-),score=2.51 TRINITY_DN26392_c0_g1_i1:23-331(-)